MCNSNVDRVYSTATRPRRTDSSTRPSPMVHMQQQRDTPERNDSADHLPLQPRRYASPPPGPAPARTSPLKRRPLAPRPLVRLARRPALSAPRSPYRLPAVPTHPHLPARPAPDRPPTGPALGQARERERVHEPEQEREQGPHESKSTSPRVVDRPTRQLHPPHDTPPLLPATALLPYACHLRTATPSPPCSHPPTLKPRPAPLPHTICNILRDYPTIIENQRPWRCTTKPT